ALLTRSGSAQSQVDPQFHEEVSRDFATFIAKKQISKADIDSLYALSPDAAKVENVKGLALEAERIGKKAEALQVWNFVYGYMSKPEDRLAAKISMAQLQFDISDRKAGAETFESAMELWKDLKTCQSSQCDELRRRSRQFVVSWNQLEKKAPSPELISAYGFYLQNFPEDTDMHTYRAQTARALKNWPVAWESYDRARAQLALLKTPESDQKLETTLVTMLDIAEESKDDKLVLKSFDNYIASSPTKTKLFEVQYQKAHRLYEAGDYATSSQQLHDLALAKSGKAKVRKQAADLSLDALVLLKNEAQIAIWAKEYSTAFAEDAGDFNQILQKSVLTKSVGLAGTDASAAYAELAQFNPSQATPEDKAKFYKNKMILAEKLNKFVDAQAAADGLLGIPTVSAEDREFAWSRKAYMSEMNLDFAAALIATDKQKNLKADERVLKMAMFAELAGQKSSAYYGQYLQTSKDDENKKLVAAELVRKSKAPEKEIELYRPILAKSPQLMAQLYTEAFAKTSSDSILKRVNKDAALKSTDAGKLLTRLGFLKEFAEFKKKITVHKLDTKNDNRLAATIKARASMLDKLEAYTKQSIEAADFTSQLVSLDLLAKETERFYNELLSAPMPAGLSDQDQQQYMSMLSAQATPFQAKAVAANAKVEEFWQNPNWSASLKAAWSQVELRNLIFVEVNALREIAPKTAKAQLAEYTVEVVQKNQAARPSIQEIQTARTGVLANPRDRQALQNLLELERKSENTAMTQYLQTRIEGLSKETL
ncbi:MAG: hypothetical protein H7326_09270, partial [Bdellovibrionaceae bacterium]|nr:hypothetical protein [Pseudobdellovibrionaceae bacterium]